jgi:hypothetical protein
MRGDLGEIAARGLVIAEAAGRAFRESFSGFRATAGVIWYP